MKGKSLLRYVSALQHAKQTELLTALFRSMDDVHRKQLCFGGFEWSDIYLENDMLQIEKAPVERLSDQGLQDDYSAYAQTVYCLSTGKKSAESMHWDAGKTIKAPVLREIVLTLCGRNNSIDPLIDRLREPYIDETHFFDGYTTVDEKEGIDFLHKKQKIESENRQEHIIEEMERDRPKSRKATFWIIWCILGVFVIGGYHIYKERKRLEDNERVDRLINGDYYSPELKEVHDLRDSIRKRTDSIMKRMPIRFRSRIQEERQQQ